MKHKMKSVLAVLTLIAMAGIANADIQLLNNTGMESHGDDGYGREMPTGGWGLWTESWNWGNIPDVEVKTLSGDGLAPYAGDASFLMNTTVSGADAALTYAMGQLGTDIGLGWYHVGGFIKGDVAAGLPQSTTVGIDIFSADWSTFYWGGGTDLASSADWTYFGFDFEVTDPSVNYNIRVKTTAGSNFQIDDMQLVTNIPEPATIGLVGIFGGALLFMRRNFKI